MRLPGAGIFRLATGRNRAELDAEAEVALHLALAEEELIAEGVPPAEARRRAQAAFGDRAGVVAALAGSDRALHRTRRRTESWSKWRSDFRLAVRGFRRDRWFAATAVALVALAIGANTAVFSVVNAALFQRLPYPASDRIVTVLETRAGGRMSVAGQNLRDWQRISRDFSALSAYREWPATVLVNGSPAIIRAGLVSGSFARVIGIEPLAGRWFAAEEARLGAAPMVVIGERYWRDHFGREVNAIGSSIRIDGVATTVVGVMPDRVDFPVGADLWIPAELFDDNPSRTAHNWHVVGRLAPGVDAASATRSLSLLTRQLLAGEPAGDRQWLADGALVTPLRETLLGQSTRLLGVLQGAVGLLLLIALVNLAALMLARAARRQPEVTMVMALGASRRDLLRRFAAESLLLAGAGAAAGLGVWLIGRPSLVVLVGRQLPFVRGLAIDGRMVAAIVALVLMVVFTGGVFPALWAARAADRGGIRADSVRVIGPGRLMQWLVGVEVTATFTLLVGAGLLGRSLQRMLEQPLGFTADDRVAMAVTLPTDDGSAYRNPGRHIAFFDQLLADVARLPGLRSVVVTTAPPLGDFNPDGSARIQGEPSDAGGPAARSDFRVVSPGFFDALGIPLRKGRDFAVSDGPATPYVVVVNEAFGRVHLHGADPIGRQVRFPGMDNTGDDRWATVVGVVGDVRQNGPSDQPEPAVYYSYRQRPQTFRRMTLIGFAPTSGRLVLDGMKATLARAEPTVPFVGAPLTSALDDVVAAPRTRALVLGVFAAAALALAGFGLFGVVGFVVLRRTRELGVRKALGARAGAVAATAMGHAGRPVVAGIVAGAVLSLGLARLIRGYLYQLSPADPAVWMAAGGAIVVVAGIACIGPVRRALGIDPAIALRTD